MAALGEHRAVDRVRRACETRLRSHRCHWDWPTLTGSGGCTTTGRRTSPIQTLPIVRVGRPSPARTGAYRGTPSAGLRAAGAAARGDQGGSRCGQTGPQPVASGSPALAFVRRYDCDCGGTGKPIPSRRGHSRATPKSAGASNRAHPRTCSTACGVYKRKCWPL